MARPEAIVQLVKEILPRPTHLLAIGSTIYVFKRDGSWWAEGLLSGNPEIDPPLPVALIGKRSSEGHSMPNAQAFTATQPFTVWYPKRVLHASRPAGTELFTYPTGLTRIQRRRGK